MRSSEFVQPELACAIKVVGLQNLASKLVLGLHSAGTRFGTWYVKQARKPDLFYDVAATPPVLLLAGRGS